MDPTMVYEYYEINTDLVICNCNLVFHYTSHPYHPRISDTEYHKVSYTIYVMACINNLFVPVCMANSNIACLGFNSFCVVPAQWLVSAEN